MSTNKISRRDMLRLVALAAGGTVLAACGPQATPTPEVVEKVVQQTVQVEATREVQVVVTATPPPKGVTSLEFWQPFGDLGKNAVDELVKEWNAANADIQVKVVFTPNVTSAGSNPKFLSAALSGNPPDIFIHDGSSFSTSTVLNAFTEIDDLVKTSGLDPAIYYPWSYQKCQWGGKTYGLPLNTDARALYSNTNILKDAGVAAPPTTIDDLDGMVDKLTKKTGDRYDVMGFIPWIGNWFLVAWGWDWGAKVFDPATNKIALNSKEMVDALTWETTYSKKYGVNQLQSFVSGFGDGANDPFIRGLVALVLTGDWMIANMKAFKPDLVYDITPAPYPTGRSAMTWSGGFVMGIPTGSKKVDDAWKFLSWFTSADAETTFAKIHGSLPCNIAAANAAYKDDPQHMKFINLLPVSFIEPVIPEWSLAWDAHVAAEQEAIYGQKTPQQALDDANAKVQAAIDQRLAGG